MSEDITIADVTGQVIDNASLTGLDGYTVEAWDGTGSYPQPMATTKTDANGRFTMRVNPATAKLQVLPDLFFKVMDDTGALLTDTEDLITWNAQLQQDVTLYIVTADTSGSQVSDKYNATQLMAMSDFFGRSDFKGVVTEATSVGGSSLSFVKDMFVNSFGNLQQPPLAVVAKRSDIIGQDAQAVTGMLGNEQITVNQVLPYAPGLNKSCLSALTSQPLNLSAGQSVNLYQQNGVVKFYSLVPGTAAQGCATPGTGAAPAPVAGKDEQIAQLQQQMTALQKAHDELKTLIQQKLPG